MATITTTKLLLLLCVLMLLTLVMKMMPLEAQSAGTSCTALILLVYTVWENYFLLPFYCRKAILKYGRSGQHMMQFGFIIKLVCCLGWFCGLAFGQTELSDALTGSVTFPALGVTCIGNLAFFYRIILRGMPDSMFDIIKKKWAARRFLAKRDKLKILFKNLNQLQGLDTCQLHGLTTRPQKVDECHVVMLSMKMPNSSMEDFMRVMSNVHKVYSIFLQCSPVRPESNVESCSCKNPDRPEGDWSSHCACIVFSAVEEVGTMLNNQFPEIVKRLFDSLYLLPCWSCLRNGCHLGRQGPSRENDSEVESPAASLKEDDSQMECPAAVCELLRYTSFMSDDAPCICLPLCLAKNDECLPLRLARNDEWTKQLLTFFEPSGNHVGVSSALKNYIFDNGECDAYENYDRVLTIVPTLTQTFIACALIFWFKVDCLSTIMVAGRALQGYRPYGLSLEYSPFAFLKRALVRSNPKNTNACQVLWFRVSRVNTDPLLPMMLFVNLICCISWMVLVALEGGANKWYHTHSMPPSEARVAVIIAAIGIAVGCDLYQLLIQHRVRAYSPTSRNMRRAIIELRRAIIALRIVIVLEILCIVSGSGVLGTLGIKAFGRWLYSAVQCLVLIKWYLGWAMALTQEHILSETFRKEGGDGRYVYASAFFLNGILAGVRAKWEYS